MGIRSCTGDDPRGGWRMQCRANSQEKPVAHGPHAGRGADGNDGRPSSMASVTCMNGVCRCMASVPGQLQRLVVDLVGVHEHGLLKLPGEAHGDVARTEAHHGGVELLEFVLGDP